MTAPRIKDEFEGKGTPQQRYLWRRAKDGFCQRCGRPHKETRRAWLNGQMVEVALLNCRPCNKKRMIDKSRHPRMSESDVKEKLYGNPDR